MKKKIIGRNKIQVQNRRQNVPGNEEEGPPSAHRVKGEADAAFWQFEWEVMSGGDKACHFLWFSIPTQPFLSHYKVILTGEKNDNGCLAACVRRTARQQPAKGLWWVPSGDRNTSMLWEITNALPQFVYKHQLLLTFWRPLENWKHWTIIFCKINKEASSEMGIFMEKDSWQLLIRMFLSKL